jgi:hypothetical protein
MTSSSPKKSGFDPKNVTPMCHRGDSMFEDAGDFDYDYPSCMLAPWLACAIGVILIIGLLCMLFGVLTNAWRVPVETMPPKAAKISQKEVVQNSPLPGGDVSPKFQPSGKPPKALVPVVVGLPSKEDGPAKGNPAAAGTNSLLPIDPHLDPGTLRCPWNEYKYGPFEVSK